MKTVHLLLGLCTVTLPAAPLPAATARPSSPPELISRLGAQTFLHGGRVHDVFFLGDSRVLLSAAEDGLYFWDTSDGGRPVSHSPQESSGRRILQAKATPDGKTIVLTSDRDEIGVMNPQSPTAIRWFKVEGAYASTLAVSADGKLAATGGGRLGFGGRGSATSSGSQVMVWDLATGQIVRQIGVSGSSVQALAFSPDGRRLASSGVRGSTTQVWSLEDGTELRHWDSYARSLAFTRDGRALAGSMETETSPGRSWRDAIKLYDVETGSVRWELGGDFDQLAFSPDSSMLVAATLEKAVVLETSSGRKVHELAYGGNLHVSGVAFSPDGTLLATGADDSRVKLWQTSDWSLMGAGTGHDGPAEAVAFSPDGRLVASGGRDNTVRLWSWPEGRQLQVFSKVGTHWGVAKLRFSDDSTRLAAAAMDTNGIKFTVWEVKTGAQLSRFGGRGGPNVGMAFLSEPDRLLTSMSLDPLTVWDVTTGKQVGSIGQANAAVPDVESGSPTASTRGRNRTDNGVIVDLVLLPGGQQVAWKGNYSGVGLWDVATGAAVRTFRPNNGDRRPEEPLLVAPDGTWLMDRDQAWDITTGERFARKITMVDDTFAGAVVSPDSRLVYKAMNDGIHAWERLTAEDIHTFGSKGMQVKGVAIAPDGRVFAAACADGSIVMLAVTAGSGYGVPAEPHTEAEFESLCRLMGGTDHWAANVAMWNLARAGAPAVDFLARKLTPAQPLSVAQLAELRETLSSRDGVSRQTAARTLLDHGIVLAPAELETLRQAQAAALQATYDANRFSGIGPNLALARGLIHDRSGQPAEPAALTPLPDRLRSSRAVGALEHSTAPAAAQVLLKALAAGYPQDPQTVEAVSALQFLKRHP